MMTIDELRTLLTARLDEPVTDGSDVAAIAHKIVIHTVTNNPSREITVIVSPSDMPELRRRLYLSYAYCEQLGLDVYDHYDCFGIRKDGGVQC